jgi:hypothetical protein
LPDEEEGRSRGDGAAGELRRCLPEAREKGSVVTAVADPPMNGSTTVLMGRREQEVVMAIGIAASGPWAIHWAAIVKKIPEPRGAGSAVVCMGFDPKDLCPVSGHRVTFCKLDVSAPVPSGRGVEEGSCVVHTPSTDFLLRSVHAAGFSTQDVDATDKLLHVLSSSEGENIGTVYSGVHGDGDQSCQMPSLFNGRPLKRSLEGTVASATNLTTDDYRGLPDKGSAVLQR